MKTDAAVRISDVGDLFAKYVESDRFEWQTAKIFFTICRYGGYVPMQEIEKQTGWSQAAVSRNVAKLGNGITQDRPGPRLVEAFEDPAYRRRKILRLTPKGRKLSEELDRLVFNQQE